MFGKIKGSGPVGELLDHLEKFAVLAKEGRATFRDKKDVGVIFMKLDRTGYIFQQATSGSMYDYRYKLERNVWNAAIHEYDTYMAELKEALLRAVDEAEAGDLPEETAPAEPAPAETEPEEELSLREIMARAEEEDRIKEETESAEKLLEEEEKALSGMTTKMTEADCRELWRIYRAMLTEYKAMKVLAARWMDENPEKGCLGITLSILLAPAAGVVYFFW